MELSHTCQVSLSELKTERIDCMIAASGFHARCTYIADKIDLKDSKKLVVTFDEEYFSDLRKENESFFNGLGFSSEKAKADSGKEIEKLLENYCRNNASRELNIIVDYSCMPKIWLATILDYMSGNELHAQIINVFFVFTPKKFIPDIKQKLEFIGPLNAKKDSIINDKNLTLVAGLNNDFESIVKLTNNIKPQKIFVFVPDPAFCHEYTRSVIEKNRSFLEKIGENNVIKYPASDPEEINSKLTSLCLDMRLHSRIILVPQGPKTFILTSLLLSLRYPDIKLWDITLRTQNYNPEEGIASGDPVILKAIFCNEDEENYD
jgi:hypothetical protein